MAGQVADAEANGHRAVILDGAVGTELGLRGIDTRSPLFSAAALLDEGGRRVLRELHAEYLRAGADVVTAATFRTNHRALEAAGQGSRFPELAQIAVAEAIAARDQHGSGLVAASMAPLADCYRPEARPQPELAFTEHLEHARALAMAGCDLFLVETIASGEEGIAAVEAASSTGLPVCAAVQIAPDGKLLDGSDPREFFTAAVAAGAGVVLLNCMPPDGIDSMLDLAKSAGVPFGAYAHIGEVDPAVRWPACARIDPETYAGRAGRWIEQGATMIGGCCGTTPAHIAALARRFGRSREG
ncbi:MAG: homocysteine S-methyltransferase family protein [Myxococcales bacterium]